VSPFVSSSVVSDLSVIPSSPPPPVNLEKLNLGINDRGLDELGEVCFECLVEPPRVDSRIREKIRAKKRRVGGMHPHMIARLVSKAEMMYVGAPSPK